MLAAAMDVPIRNDEVLNDKPAQMVQPEQVFLERPPSWRRKMPADSKDDESVNRLKGSRVQEHARIRFGESNGAQS